MVSVWVSSSRERGRECVTEQMYMKIGLCHLLKITLTDVNTVLTLKEEQMNSVEEGGILSLLPLGTLESSPCPNLGTTQL